MAIIRAHLKANDAAMNVILNTSYQDESENKKTKGLEPFSL